MESIHCSSPSLPIPSFITNQYPIPTKGRSRRRTHLYFLTKQRLLPSLSSLRPQAVDTNSLGVAAAPVTGGGDISVLIQVSAVLLLMYWISNFVVPEIVTKNMEKKASEEEQEKVPVQEPNASSEANTTTNEPKKAKKKFKKEDIKKMIGRR